MTGNSNIKTINDETEKAAAVSKVAEIPEHPLTKYTLSGKYLGSPYSIFCSGCGYGAIAMAINGVLKDDEENIKKHPFVIGIGCYTSLSTLLPANQSVTALHGRPLPVATGVKLAKPDLKPIVITGDGDCLAIGAGHFVNACRRNLDVVTIMLHNNVYGMTGGQLAPTLPTGNIATTAPYGYAEEAFDAVELAIASGATHVARYTTLHIREFSKALKKAIKHKGFSFIEVISTCPTNYGRKNGFPKPINLFRWVRDNAVHIKDADHMNADEKKDKFIIGEFKCEKRPDLNENYSNIEKIAKRGGK